MLKSFFGVIVAAVFSVGCETQTDPPAATSTPASTPTDTSAHNDADEDHHTVAAQDDHGDADIAEAMAALSPADRKAAEAQKFCAVSTSSPLGSMGTPLKLEIKGEPVFLCCGGCKSKALKNPDETLAAVAKLRTDNSGDAK